MRIHPLAGRKWTKEQIQRRIDAGAGRPANTPEVLWSKVDIRGEDECWPWKGFKNEQGYGRTWIDNKGYYAHRVIFNLAKPGVIELSAPKRPQDPGFLMHSCDNPACCNPKHLSVCSHAENMEDKKQKGRAKIFTSYTSPRAKLTKQDVEEIRHLLDCWLSSSEISAAYGVSKSSIKSIRAGRTYG